MNLLSLAQQKTQLKRTAGTHGGEWTGPCPGCGGRDRFHVWPEKADSKRQERLGVYWCRSCGKSGDVVQFLVDFDGVGYAEALRSLGIERQNDAADDYRTPQRPRPPGCTSNCTAAPQNYVQAQPQSDVWLEKAKNLVEHAANELKNSEFALKWLKKRGISKKTAINMRLGWLLEDRFRARALWGLPESMRDDGKPKKLWIPAGLVIPLIDASGQPRRIRIRRWAEREPRYYVLPGSSMSCMAHWLPARVAVVVESELDAIMLAGIASDLAAVVALGSATSKPGADLRAALDACALVLVALDADRAGAEAMRWWREALPRSKSWPVPAGKDPGEAYAAGVDLRKWIEAGMPRGFVLGPSPRGLVVGRAAAEDEGKAATTGGECAQLEADQAVTPAGERVGACRDKTSIDELAGLLRAHPVEIRVAKDGSRVLIRENQVWKRKNWDTSRRISALVYRPDVLEHLWALGVEVVNGKNIAALAAKDG